MRSSAAAHSPIAPQPPASTAMFRTSPRADPAHESPTKKAASSLRNFFFHSDEPQQTSPTKSSATQPADCVSPPAAARPASRRDTFQRANSHPVRLDASHALSASRAFDPSMTRAAALDGASSRQPQATPTLRSTVFGSCSHVLSAVIMALFQTVRTHHECIAPVASPSIDISLHSPPDSSTVRKAKLLYISLLEKAQKERGEWQGFVEEPHDENQRQGEDESALDTLTKAIQEMPKDEAFIILHELLGLSFRNLRVSLVCPNIYAKHKPNLAIEPLECPPSLEMLLRVREFISELSGDEKRCLLRLLLLWHAICVVDPINQSLKRLVEDKHSLILNESSEMEFVQQAARKAMRHDPIAVDLLVMMTHYRDVLFSELELFKIHREMQIEARYHTEDDSLCPSDGTQSEPHDDQDQDDHNNIPLAVPVMLDEATETDEEEPTAQRTSDTHSPVVTIQLGKGAVRPSRTSPSRKATKSRGHESSADSSRTKQPRRGSQRALDSAGTGRRSTSDKLNMKATRRTMLKSPRIVITPAVVATTRKEPVKKAKDNSDDHQWMYVCIGASVAIAAACTATMAVVSLRRHARQ